MLGRTVISKSMALIFCSTSRGIMNREFLSIFHTRRVAFCKRQMLWFLFRVSNFLAQTEQLVFPRLQKFAVAYRLSKLSGKI